MGAVLKTNLWCCISRRATDLTVVQPSLPLPVGPADPDIDLHPWANARAWPQPVPIPREMTNAQKWSCPGHPGCPAPGQGGWMGPGSQVPPQHKGAMPRGAFIQMSGH